MGPVGERTAFGRLLGYLRTHPIVCLAILTPGIPEYLSTSSSILNLALNPFWCFLQLAINVAQYTAGALLIREAVLRWHQGWGTVFLLGLAYGITEEGLGDNTLFNPAAAGTLGSFGHFAGVSWVWATGVLSFHVIYSIGLPLLLLSLAVPSTRGRSLLGRRGILLGLLSVAASTGIETAIVYHGFHFWMGTPLLVGALVAIALLVSAAYFVPAALWRPTTERARLTPAAAGVIGFAVFPVLFFCEYFVPFLGAPALVIIAVEVLFLGGVLELLRRGVGRTENNYVLVTLAYGFILWQSMFGLLVTFPLVYNIPLVVIAVAFFTRLRRAYRPTAAAPPPGALGA